MLRQTITFLVAVSLTSTTSSLHGGSGVLDHPPGQISARDCGGSRRTCLDRSTLLHCLPVFNKMVPAFTETCSDDTPMCLDDKCLSVPRTQYRHTRATQGELDLTGVVCNGKSSVCLNCTMTVHCIQSGDKFYPIIPTACPFHTPYCIDGKCGTKDPGHCKVQPPPDSTFKCAEGVEGYLPDPENCSVYHFCAKKTSYDYTCAGDTLIYNQQKAMCLKKNESCFHFECTRPLEYVVYAPDPSVYALCKGAGAAGAILAKCPENHSFNISAELCSRTCLTEGRQFDPDNVNAYFECSRVNDAWLLTPAVCPAGATFDKNTEKCVLN